MNLLSKDHKVWIYIVISSVLQTFWGITLKKLNFQLIYDLISQGYVFNYRFVLEILPLILYFLLGILIVLFISKAYKLMPMSQVYAFWMGLTLIFQTLIDIFYFNDPINVKTMFFIALILVGIIGMKKFENPKAV